MLSAFDRDVAAADMVGDVMPNGYRVIAAKVNSSGEFVVLGMAVQTGKSFPHPVYASWRMDDGGDTFFGHYFESKFQEAADDFAAR